MNRNLSTEIVCLFVLLSLALSVPAYAASDAPPDSRITVSPGMKIERLVVKFDEPLRMRLRNGSLVSLSGIDTDGLKAAIGEYTLKPLFVRDETELDEEYRQLSAIAPHRAVDKNSYFQIDITDHSEAERCESDESLAPGRDCLS
jgi:hypothetical protein